SLHRENKEPPQVIARCNGDTFQAHLVGKRDRHRPPLSMYFPGQPLTLLERWEETSWPAPNPCDNAKHAFAANAKHVSALRNAVVPESKIPGWPGRSHPAGVFVLEE